MGGAIPGVMLEFSSAVQSLGALQAAAYRLVGTATCEIDQVADRFVCRLTPVSNPNRRTPHDSDGLRAHFLNLVTDESLRERIAARTDSVRNVILALAFGSLVNAQDDHP
jgi:His-Xaa-Ser system protein HxsD